MIYVAASARELPVAVQEWLAQPHLRAAASPNVYDALASLSMGLSPVALIVSIESVDWIELDFFTHVARISPDTLVFVAGPAHQEAKLQAAIALGARPFDAESLNDALAVRPAPPRAVGPAGLLAGSLRTDVETAAAPPRLVRDAPAEPPTEPAISDDELERPPVRLVSSTETQETETPVPFPWSPAPDRPQRTPPKSESAPPRERQRESSRRPPVKLTPEELSALLEPPAGGAGKVQEGGT